MTKKLIYFLVFAFGFAFVSCDKYNDIERDSGVTVNTVSTKWDILDNNSLYTSFEFNKDGNYIVVKNNGERLRSLITNSKNSLFKNNSLRAASTSSSNLSPIHFGTYQIDGNKIILSDFGIIEVISITAEEFSFTLETTGKTNSFVAKKSSQQISSSNKTEMFCRTWVIQKITDESGKKDEYWRESDIIGSIVLFSKAGTYLVLYGGEGGDAGLSKWKWANKEETKIYSWNKWKDDWEEENFVTINQLNDNTLVLQEVIDDEVMVYHLTLKK